MSRTLADLRAEILSNLGALSSDPEFVNLDTPDLNRYINQALQTIDSEADWPWSALTETISTVNGTRAYSPAATWYRTNTLTLADYGPLKFLEIDDFAQQWLTPTDTGIPAFYTVNAGQLQIGPTPNGVWSLVHSYYGAEPELIDDGDEPLLPDRFRPRLIDMASALAAGKLRLEGLYQRFAGRDSGHEKRMRDDRLSTRSPFAARTRHGTWSQL